MQLSSLDLSALRAKFAAMQQKHIEQEMQTAEFMHESSQLLETYANAVSFIFSQACLFIVRKFLFFVCSDT